MTDSERIERLEHQVLNLRQAVARAVILTLRATTAIGVSDAEERRKVIDEVGKLAAEVSEFAFSDKAPTP